MQQRALVRRPGPRLADGLLTHIDRTPVDGELALRQWQGYVDALRAEGWETIEVPPTDDCPDAVFVEDTVVVHGDLAVISRPGAAERRPETAGTERTLAALGYRIAPIEAPAMVDDLAAWPAFLAVPEEEGSHVVLLDGATVLMSSSAPATRALLEARGLRVVAVDATEFEELEGCVTCLSVHVRALTAAVTSPRGSRPQARRGAGSLLTAPRRARTASASSASTTSVVP